MNHPICSQCGKSYKSRACGPTHALIANERKASTGSDAPHSDEWLRERGWSTWYNENYWVHPKTIQNPEVQDYTNYGMSLEKAIEYEKSGAAPFPSVAPIQRAISSLYQQSSELQPSHFHKHLDDSYTACDCSPTELQPDTTAKSGSE